MPEANHEDSESGPILQADALGEAPPAPRPYTGLAATFRSLRHRNYRLYFFGQMVSLTGTWMQNAALVWLAGECSSAMTGAVVPVDGGLAL